MSSPTYFNELVSRNSKESKISSDQHYDGAKTSHSYSTIEYSTLRKCECVKIFPWITIRDIILTSIYFWYSRECRSDTSLSDLSPAEGGGRHYFIFRAWTEQERWTIRMPREVRQRKQKWWELAGDGGVGVGGSGSMLNPCRALSYICNKWTCKFMHVCKIMTSSNFAGEGDDVRIWNWILLFYLFRTVCVTSRGSENILQHTLLPVPHRKYTILMAHNIYFLLPRSRNVLRACLGWIAVLGWDASWDICSTELSRSPWSGPSWWERHTLQTDIQKPAHWNQNGGNWKLVAGTQTII